MLKTFAVFAVIAAICTPSVRADALPATFTTNPGTLVYDLPFDVTISTADLGEEVYLFTWCHHGPAVSWGWNDSMTPKFRMEGSGGVYTIHIEDLRLFYGLSTSQLADVTALGFIARNAAGQQTVDLIAEVLAPTGNTYSGGSGTPDEPFLISTISDFTLLQASPSDWHKCFLLIADLALDAVSPIGTQKIPFRGRFDGASHILSDINVTATIAGEPCGLFGRVTDGAIHDLALSGVTSAGGTFTGTLVGLAEGSASIERCFATGSVTGSSICTGGLIGENRGATVHDCYSSAKVVSAGYAAGGIAGKNTGSISDCYATGEVNAQGGYAGGISGANYGDINRCAAVNTAVSSGSSFTGRVGGNANARNGGDSNLSWSGTAGILDLDAPCFGDNADVCPSETLREMTAYASLGWDFDTVWEWRSDAGRGWPALRGFANQKRSMPDALYSMMGIVSAPCECSIAVNVANGTLDICADKGLRSVCLLTVSGAVASTTPCREATHAVVNLSHLPSGIYILRAEMTDGTFETVKLVNL